MERIQDALTVSYESQKKYIRKEDPCQVNSHRKGFRILQKSRSYYPYYHRGQKHSQNRQNRQDQYENIKDNSGGGPVLFAALRMVIFAKHGHQCRVRSPLAHHITEHIRQSVGHYKRLGKLVCAEPPGEQDIPQKSEHPACGYGKTYCPG